MYKKVFIKSIKNKTFETLSLLNINNRKIKRAYFTLKNLQLNINL